jgi:hypothetical protein
MPRAGKSAKPTVTVSDSSAFAAGLNASGDPIEHLALTRGAMVGRPLPNPASRVLRLFFGRCDAKSQLAKLPYHSTR